MNSAPDGLLHIGHSLRRPPELEAAQSYMRKRAEAPAHKSSFIPCNEVILARLSDII